LKLSDSGEICLRGINLAKSYFKGTMEADWISTGDLGEITENGALKVIDRVSNVYKLTQGEQIHPLKLEHIYM
jgi:long-chain acyl-CoA synthetase